jgi:hypothetical protein
MSANLFKKIYNKLKFLPFYFFIATTLLSSEEPAGLFLLDANPNSRLHSMGNVSSAVDYTDSFSNPASLGWSPNYGFLISHWPGKFTDSSYNFISSIFPIKDVKNGLFSISYLSYTSGDELIEELDGTTHSITLESDKLISFGYGSKLKPEIYAGGNIKYLHSSLAEEYSASSFLFDLNIMKRTLDDKETFEFGLFNFGGGLKYLDQKEDLPSEIRFGYSYKKKLAPNSPLITSAGLKFIKGGSKALSIGAEVFPKNNFFSIRAGINKRTDLPMDFNIGFGVRFPNIDFDLSYALKKNNDLNQSQSQYRFSLNYYFGSRNEYDIAKSYFEKGDKEKALALWGNILPGEKYYDDARLDIKKYREPPILNVYANLKDSNNDQVLAGGEDGEILINITNKGKSIAEGVQVNLKIDETKFGDDIKIPIKIAKTPGILPGETKTVSFPISASSEISVSKIPIEVNISEKEGYNPPPYTFYLNTKRFPPPNPLLAKYTFREDNTGLSQGNGNGIIEKGETVEVTGILSNFGESEARIKEVSLLINSNDIELKTFTQEKNFTLKPCEYKKILFVLKISENYKGPDKLPILLKIKEEREKYSKTQPINLSLKRFYLDPLTSEEAEDLSLLSKLPDLPGPIPFDKANRYKNNSIQIAGAPDLDFSYSLEGDENNNGVYEPGENLILKFRIRNYGTKTAENVKLNISGDDFIKNLLKEHLLVGDIPAGSVRTHTIEIPIPNSIPRKTSNFNIGLKEKNGFNPNKILSLSVGFQPKETKIEKTYPPLRPVPIAKQKNDSYYAIVIGISNYLDKSLNLKYSSNDSFLIKEYLENTLGIPSKNIKFLSDEKATKSSIEANINSLVTKLKSQNQKTEKIFFYFSGHGIFDTEDPTTKTPFILPYDANLEYGNQTLISLKDISLKLKETGADVIMIVDSCFSGTKKGNLNNKEFLLARKGIAIEPIMNYENTIIFSASNGKQMAGEFDKVKNSYFTYYFLLGLKGEADINKDGKITDIELCEYVKEKVSDETDGAQTPECKAEKETVLVKYK